MGSILIADFLLIFHLIFTLLDAFYFTKQSNFQKLFCVMYLQSVPQRRCKLISGLPNINFLIQDPPKKLKIPVVHSQIRFQCLLFIKLGYQHNSQSYSLCFPKSRCYFIKLVKMDLIFDFSGENLSVVIFVSPGLNFQNAGLHIITLLHTLTHVKTL